MVVAAHYPADSPERAFAEYLDAWYREDWDKMASWTQKTWRSSEDDAAEKLYFMYDFKELVGTQILHNSNPDDISVKLTAKISYWITSEGDVETKTIRAMVIRETAPYTPSAQGEWGVNPISTLREE